MMADDDWLHDEDAIYSKEIIEREWESRRREFHVSGMRDGYDAGKEETVQEGFDQGFILGARSGLAWGCVKGAASVSLAFTSQYDTQEHEDVLSAVRDMDHKDIRKHACASLWDEYGEMKGRFPEHHTESAKAMDVSQNEIRQQAVSVLPQIQGILDSMNT